MQRSINWLYRLPQTESRHKQEARSSPSTRALAGCASPLVMTGMGLLQLGVASPPLSGRRGWADSGAAHLSPNQISPDSKRQVLRRAPRFVAASFRGSEARTEDVPLLSFVMYPRPPISDSPQRSGMKALDSSADLKNGNEFRAIMWLF